VRPATGRLSLARRRAEPLGVAQTQAGGRLRAAVDEVCGRLSMSARAVVEVGVCLMRFTNVDLRAQGLYRIAVSLERVASGADAKGLAPALGGTSGGGSSGAFDAHAAAARALRGTAYSCFESQLRLSQVGTLLVTDSLLEGRAARLDAANDIFYSKSFSVRYMDEERALADGAVFRLELEATREARDEALRLQRSLERQDFEDPRLQTARISEGKQQQQRHKGKQAGGFTRLCTRTLLLHAVAEGLHEFQPVVFDELHTTGFALLQVTLHSCVTSVRFEQTTLPQLLGAERSLRLCEDDLSAQRAEAMRAACLFLLRSSLAQLRSAVEQLVAFSQPRQRLGLARYPTHPPRPPGETGGEPGSSSEKSVLDAAGVVELDLESLARMLDRKPNIAPRLFVKSGPSVGANTSAETAAATSDAPGETRAGALEAAGGARSARPAGAVETLGEFADALAEEVDQLSSTLQLAWFGLMQELRVDSRLVLAELRIRWLRTATERVGESIIRERVHPSQLLRSTTHGKRREMSEVADRIRASTEQIRQFQKDKVEDFQVFDDASSLPVLFEQRYDAGEQERGVPQEEHEAPAHAAARRGTHVVVLVHGYLGSSWDLRPFRNYLSILEPSIVTMLSKANEDDTDSDIEVLGFRLAREVSEFLREHLSNARRPLARLSFVCHSIGSIVLRCALGRPELAPFVPHLHTVLSLSSPHLASRGRAMNSLVRVGMAALRHLRKATALAQLAMTDDADPRETLLYRLSKKTISLRSFQNILLVSSAQDTYVPYHSARVEPLLTADSAALDAEIAAEMSANLLADVDPRKVLRLDLNFRFDTAKTSRFDALIGRAAHVKVLESPALALMLLLQYRETHFQPST
jgi:hypothetical protein